MDKNLNDFEIARIIKSDIRSYHLTLDEVFKNSSGKDFLVKHTRKIDSVLKFIYKAAIRNLFFPYIPMKNSIPITLVALGSYGREQLCVHSDIDLMIVYKKIDGYNVDAIIEKILYILWDTGLQIGHRVHEVSELFEVSKIDITIKTALLESRFIEGSHALWTQTQNMLQLIRHHEPQDYIAQKIKEYQSNTIFEFIMEPNLKKGVGGFRDANLVFWIGKARYDITKIKNMVDIVIEDEDYREFHIALDFIFRVRGALHLIAKKKDDTLRLDYIYDVAIYLGFGDKPNSHIKLYKKVMDSLQTTHRYSMVWVELLSRSEAKKAKMEVDDFHHLLDELILKERTNEINYQFIYKLMKSKKPQRLNKELIRDVQKIFAHQNAYLILKTLMDAKMLGYIIPPMKRVMNLAQFDGYHHYSVDVHSLKSLYFLENIEDEFLRSLFNSLSPQEQFLLKIVTVLHDVGKGRKQDHSIVGAKVFKIFAQKLSMDSSFIEMGQKIILFHTLMSKVAQREDIYSEQTILKFASHFPSERLLKMIYIFTYADMSAVGGNVYSNFTAKLLRTLYKNSLEVIGNDNKLKETSKRVKNENILMKKEEFLSLPKSLQNAILSIPSDFLFTKYAPLSIIEISKNAISMKGEYVFKITNTKSLIIELIRKTCINIGYLLSKLSNLDIVNMDICKLFDGMKYFKIEFRESIDESQIELIESFIEGSFSKKSNLKLTKPKLNPFMFDVDCTHSQEYALMRLKCPNQKGLFAYVISIFDELNIDIASAKLNTIKNRVDDIFLIEKNSNFCKQKDTLIEKLTQ
ncbi:MAG: HD domain-containing protein [Epsilonproteobacteria bacterium]|nr:HD domain-containing protein [Campylobacterota bacterium]